MREDLGVIPSTFVSRFAPGVRKRSTTLFRKREAPSYHSSGYDICPIGLFPQILPEGVPMLPWPILSVVGSPTAMLDARSPHVFWQVTIPGQIASSLACLAVSLSVK